MIKNLVTIAIPAFKDKWLAQAIESALNQEYENIELIIVDDHSPFGLEKIVTPYLKDKRIRYYYNDTNLGKESIVHNWNKCVDLAKGEFFVLLCDDDILRPNFVSSLVGLAEKYPDCNVFHGRKAFFDDLTGEIKEESQWPVFEDFSSFIEEEYAEKRKHTITEFLFRSFLIKKEKYEIFPVGYFSDNATILKLVKHGGIASSKEVICLFRKSNEHISGNSKYAFGKAKAALLYYKWYQNNINIVWTNKRKKNWLDRCMAIPFKEANTIDKIKILKIVPHEIWGYKQKLYMLLSIIGINHIINLFKRN